jgi:hypothetical protein
MAHKVFLAFVAFMALTALAVITIHGWGYYLSPVDQRPFRPDYNEMKPSSNYSHGLGIIGSAFVTIGVATYSTRKRVRRLWKLGKLSAWLEFHIALCLLGPILVVYHTTFKAGGIAATSLWCMVSVASSGIVGLFLYGQMPRNIKGIEMTDAQIKAEVDGLTEILLQSKYGKHMVREIDGFLGSIERPRTIIQGLVAIYRLFSGRTMIKRFVHAMIAQWNLPEQESKEVYKAAVARTTLQQRTIVLEQVSKIFNYWHAIHVPFTVIMFLTLAAHVTVTILLGYHWIF